MPKPLTEATLYRLTRESLVSFLGQAERFEAVMHRGVCLALSHEPVADLNCLVAGHGAADGEHFGDACRSCLSRGLPFLAVVFPAAGSAVERTAAQLGLVHAVDFPTMVRDAASIEPSGNDAVIVSRASGAKGADGNARVLASAFGMPEKSVRRAMPVQLLDSPNLDVFLATLDGDVVGAVTVTYHGDTAGIWALGTDATRQRGGIGRRLLSTAMAEACDQGAQRFFLGSTQAGYHLYESLGYTTRVVAKVWVSGQIHQA